MEFINSTGHIFSLKDWSSYPTGYEYEIDDHIFWIESDVTSHKLSVGNYYVKPIRFIVDDTDDIIVELKDSDHFYLLSSTMIQNKIENNKNIFDEISISTDNMVTRLSKEDLCIVDCDVDKYRNVNIATFYVVTTSQEVGSWLTNILIKNGKTWCPITVGGEFYMESSELIVNGQNMGVWIPKDILNSLYGVDVLSNAPDEMILNDKLKELLLNYMHIKGECGNYESAKDSLEWFGYGKHMNIRQLLQTDNQFLTQFVQDNFDVDSDNLWNWKKFRRASAYSIWIDINRYQDEDEEYKYDDELVGEGKPLVENLFDKYVYETYDEEDIKFWKPYYDWKLDDMYLKMAMVEYYWKKYFLPISFSLSSSSMKQHCFMNDIKYIVKPSISVSETPIWIGDTNTFVKFSDEDIYLYDQKVYFDKNYNEFINSQWIGENTEEDMLFINDICARIPIWFGSNSDTDEDFFNVNLILSRDKKIIYTSSFSFYQRKGDMSYKNFIMIPKSLSKNFKYSYWVGKNYRISICCNGNWYYHDFKLKVPEFQLKVGKLEYQYFNYSVTKELKEGDEGYIDIYNDDYNLTDEEKKSINIVTSKRSLFTQIKSITDNNVEFNAYMYDPKLVEVNDINFFDKLKYIIDTASDSGINTSNFNSNSGSTMSINSFCDYLASKCYIYGIGLEKKQDSYKKGNSVVPMFRFNNGLELGNIKGYTLKKFNVDILFDVDAYNNYYAKESFSIDDLNTIDPVKCDFVNIYPDLDQQDLIRRKKDLGLKNDPSFDINGLIDWNKTKMENPEWTKFYIDEHVRHKSNIVIRFVTTGKIELPNGKTYDFGGYKDDGTPRIFQDMPIVVLDSGNNNVCTMKCNCPWAKECKFKEGNLGNQIYDYPLENNPVEDKKNEIMSKQIKASIDSLITSISSNISIQNNKKYLNRIHIYNLYLKEMPKDQRKRLGLNKSQKTMLKYDKDKFDIKWYSQNKWEQPLELVEMYRLFFEDDGTCKVDVSSNSNMFNYDFYLMHDDDNWFVVFISQETEDTVSDKEYYNMPDKIEYDNNGVEFVMKRYRSSDRFLINRMMFVDNYPINHFKQDDLIVATIDNVRFPFILDKTTKWSVKNLSLKYKGYPFIVQNTNSMILSLYNDINANIAGYYDINVMYSVDGITDQKQEKHIRILIE